MKNFRVLKTVNKKGIIPGFDIKSLGMVLLFLLMLPYPVTFLFGNLATEEEKSLQTMVRERLTEGEYYLINRTNLGEESIPLELYVADKLSGTTDGEEEPEVLKAKAILIRTNLFRQIQDANKEGNRDEAYGHLWETDTEKVLVTEDDLYGSREISEEVYLAVAETAGQCAVYDGEPILGAYFAVSSGMTRTGEEAGINTAPYLKSVLCGRDYLAENYSDSLELKKEQFERVWESIPAAEAVKEKEAAEGEGTDEIQREETFYYIRDNAGYVLYLEYQEKQVLGEAFRKAFSLNSACFSIRKEDEKYVIEVKGAGHGFGMSCFTAKLLAAEGKNYQEILEYFFQDVTIVKIE